jgi:site-specific DNA recombinase
LRAVLYCRVSTVEQTQNLSLPTQEKACRDYCARNGYEVDRVFIDAGESAKSTDRPEFLRLLTYCREQRGKLHAVVVYALTRFSRQQADHHAITTLLRGLGISLRSVTEPIDESPSGRLMEGILAAMAQFDNDARAERTVAGMKAAIDRGRWVWRAPIGYLNGAVRSGPSLVPDPARAPAVREAFALAAAGIRGRTLLQRLEAMGLRTRQGNPLTSTTLYSVLQNRVYVGYVRSAGWSCEVRGDFEPLVDEDTFGRVQRELVTAPTSTRAIARHLNHPDFPLRRFARCGTCDRPLTGGWSKGNGGKYAYYQCQRGCTRTPAPVLEARFLALLDRLRPHAGYWDLFKAGILVAWEESRQSRSAARVELQRQVAALEKQSARLDQAFIFERSIDTETYQAQRDRVREQLTIARIELTDASERERSIEDDLAYVGSVLSTASVLWTDAASVEARQRLQWTLFPLGVTVTATSGSISKDGHTVIEPQIAAVSCLEFFELPSSSTSDASMASLTGATLNRGLAFLAHFSALRLAA